ncbi:pyruvate dehydrogenase [acetyl-transferring]-phosphatase 2, mitochondrial [Halyomorpha halys]|uniref:pyruvate dehydrogenase [acetyl-transferring]-phosphatase 2, mitochondrial n=1 Tax=Halyomorpha halys TaxID=286706 RepID=UPI0006D51BF2|nr:pyruvate dehydrogenase [acetyl-transferring]-phosphatase 2, mitochondrial-like [Halyomorpha halys]
MKCYRGFWKTLPLTTVIKRLSSSGPNVSDKLRKNEIFKKYDPGFAISHLYANKVGAHTPIQETWAEARCLHNKDIMFGVFDGNSGSACSHVVAKRLFPYLQASLLPKNVLKQLISMAKNDQNIQFLDSFQDKYFFLQEYQQVYEDSFKCFLQELVEEEPKNLEYSLKRAFERLDDDMSKEAMGDKTNGKRFLWVAMTGSGATVLHLSGLKATLSTAGDALVVVGTEDGRSKVLTPEHNVENEKEVSRVLQEHPGEVGLVRDGHLLGALTALRSFGNFRYKWNKDTIKKFLVPHYGESAVPEHSLTPPYITASPDIGHYTICPEDKFIVIASDGIWDIFPPEKVVNIILNHRPVHQAVKMLMAPYKKFQHIRSILRKEDFKEEVETMDSPATQLILEGLVNATKLLKLPDKFVRNIRDDMTVLILYIDQAFVKVHAKEQNSIKLKENTLVKSEFII